MKFGEEYRLGVVSNANQDQPNGGGLFIFSALFFGIYYNYNNNNKWDCNERRHIAAI